MATETIINYVKACTDAFLFYQVKRQDVQGKKLLAINEKYYVADHGIREAVFGGNMKDINLILENIVYLELLRRGYKVSIGKVDTKEIDFICEKQEKKFIFKLRTYWLQKKLFNVSSVFTMKLPIIIRNMCFHSTNSI